MSAAAVVVVAVLAFNVGAVLAARLLEGSFRVGLEKLVSRLQGAVETWEGETRDGHVWTTGAPRNRAEQQALEELEDAAERGKSISVRVNQWKGGKV